MTDTSFGTTRTLAADFAHIAVLQDALRSVALSLAGRSLLDVGTGDGRALLGLEQAGAAVPIGIDPRLLPATTAHSRRRKGSGEALAFADNSFDALTFFFSLHHHPNPRGAITEVGRVLRSGGLACFVEPVAAGPLYDLERWIDDEAQVRSDAQAALDEALGAPATPWQQVLCLTYHHPETYAALDQLLSEMLGVDPERAARAERNKEQLEAAFAACPDGVFDQPYLLRVFQRR